MDDVFPWTNMGEWRWDVPEDDLGHDDSISSANTSIVQQAARWISPNVSSDSLERPRLSRAHDASPITPLLMGKEVSTASMDADTHDFYMYMQVVRQSVPERAYIPFPELIPPQSRRTPCTCPRMYVRFTYAVWHTLVLASSGACRLVQQQPYAEIHVYM